MSKRTPVSPKEMYRGRLVKIIKATLEKIRAGEIAIDELRTVLNEALQKIKGKVKRVIQVVHNATLTKVRLRVQAMDARGQWIAYGITVNSAR